MKKPLIPQALAILVCIANTSSSFSADDQKEQKNHFQSALSHLDELGVAQKKETEVKAETEKKKMKVETLDARVRADLLKSLQMTSEDAKKWAYEIASKLDQKGKKRHAEDLKFHENHPDILMPAFLKDGTNKYTENKDWLQTLEKKIDELEKKREREMNRIMGDPAPSYFLVCNDQIFVGIGHHLFANIMDRYSSFFKAASSGYLSTIPMRMKTLEESTQWKKKWFMDDYVKLNTENARKIKDVAEMKGIKLSS